MLMSLFQERLLPCSHAMTVLMALDRQDDAIDFSHECYLKTKTMQAYTQEFHPVDMNQLVARELAPFDAPPRRGAPAIARIRIHARRRRAVAEAGRKCRSCGLSGHYAKTCGRQRRRRN